jgi:cell division protein FtsI/penicillin-binding protein 2
MTYFASRHTGHSWRRYQERRAKYKASGRIARRLLRIVSFSLVFVLVFYWGTGKNSFYDKTGEHGAASTDGETRLESYRIDKVEVQKLLADKRLVNLEEKSFETILHGVSVRVDTSLDVSLQRYLQKKLKRSTSRYIGIVIMDAAAGDIVSMVGYNKMDPAANPCIDNRYPAASVFKIITAAAAVEACGLDPNSILTYNGRKYTLYRSQLKDRRNRYTRKITLRDSFAQSINPVFGKIGARRLGKSNLEKYAEAFGFNRNIDFEIPVTPSRVTLSDEPYRLAEIASGFNRETTISPLHGVLLPAAVLNEGKLITPTIIEKVTDEHGHVMYRSDLTTINQAVTPEASGILGDLMQETIRSGTSKKAFRGYRRDRILSKLIIGGKTGSISGKTPDTRYDWFVGFAEEKQGSVKLAISIVVAHEKYIGTRASRYARMAIRHYFENYYSKQITASDIARESS